MSTSFIDHAIPHRLLAVLLAVLLAGCAGAPKQQVTVDNVNVIKPVRATTAAVAPTTSDATHVTIVAASPQAQAAAQQAAGDYFAGIQMMKAGKLDDALVVFQQMAAQHPMLSGPLVNQGLIYLRQEKWGEVLNVLDQALKINPQNPFAWNQRGVAFRAQGKFKDARAAYEKALAIDPQYAKAHFNLGVLADLYLQDLQLALLHYERYQSLQRKPDQAVGNWIADLRNRLGIATPTPTVPAASTSPADNAAPNSTAAPDKAG